MGEGLSLTVLLLAYQARSPGVEEPCSFSWTKDGIPRPVLSCPVLLES